MSLRKAIDQKCKSCIYDPLNGGTWRQQVLACSVTDCPLYPVRPLPKGVIPRKDAKMAPKTGLEGDSEAYGNPEKVLH